jgi:hypothetical protein
MYKKTVESYGIDFTQMHQAYTADAEHEYVTEEILDMITEVPTEKIAEAEEPTVVVEEPVVEAVTEAPATEDVPATIEDVPVTAAKTTSRKKSKK